MKAFTFTLHASVLAGILFSHIESPAQSTAFTYQGRLNDGANGANGIYDFRFGLFATNADGVPIAGPVTNAAVAVSAGLFTVTLDFGQAFTGGERWLEVGVRTNGGNFTMLNPRQPITRAPYAIQAGTAFSVADGSITSTKLSAGPATNGQVLKASGGALSWGTDNDTLYSAGAGLNLAGTTFNIAFGDIGTSSQVARSDHTHAVGDLVSGILAVERGGTGASNPSNALANLGGASLIESNFFNGINKLLNGDNQFVGAFSGDGGGLTNLNVRTTIIASNEIVLSFDPAHFGISDGTNIFIRSGALLANPIVASGTITGDGSGLTNLNAGQVGIGTVPVTRGGTGAATASNALVNLGGASLARSNVFSGANTMLNPGNRFAGTFSGNGTFLLGLDAENLVGTLQSAQLAGTYSRAVILNNVSNRFSGGFSGDGSGLTNLDVNSVLGSGALPVARGGTGAGTVGGARVNLGAAASGANADITSLNALSTPLSVAQGGTGATAERNALVNLGGASLTESNSFGGVNAMLNPANRFAGAFSGDGSGLMTLNAGNLNTGTLPGAQLAGTYSNSVTLNNVSNRFSGSFSGDGSGLTGLNAGNLNTGTLPSARLAGTYSSAVALNNPANSFLGSFSGDGAGVTGLNASNLGSGLVSIARGGTGAGIAGGARANLGAAASGANADITSLHGLSTPLSVAQGGTGASTPANALINIGGAALTQPNLFSGANTMLHPANQFAGTFSGNGSSLTGLDAGNLNAGTLPSARLSGTYSGALVFANNSNVFSGEFIGEGSALNNVNAAALAGFTPSGFWQLGGNPATTVGSFLGTTDNQPLDLRVNGVQGLRIEPNPVGGPNVIAAGAVAIGTNNPSGRTLFVSGPVGVGGSNVLEMGAGVAGKNLNAGKIGYQTLTPGALDIVGAGTNATSRRIKFWAEAGATFNGTGTNPAVVVANTVDESAAISFAAPFSTWRVGQNKPPDAPGVFDSFFIYQQNAAATRLIITDSGRVGLGTNTPAHPLDLANGAYCTAGGVWTSVSDRNAKTNFTSIQPREVLAKVATLPILQWKYKAETNGIHLGPTAQDFHAAFGLGESDKAIGAVDAEGVALAAIQGLNDIVREKDAEIQTLKAKNQEMDERLRVLEARFDRLSGAEHLRE